MPIVVVYTDKGEQVWQSPALAFTLTRALCPSNTIGSALISGLRRAVEDAEAIEQGRDPEWPSEWAMRESSALRNVAGYTIRHMENLIESGRTVEPFRQGDERDKNRARSRILNAARRLDIKVETFAASNAIIGTVKEIPMKARDREYIEDRLLAPAVPLNEAIERLFETGEDAAAETASQLHEAATILIDVCQGARHQLWYPEREQKEKTP